MQPQFYWLPRIRRFDWINSDYSEWWLFWGRGAWMIFAGWRS